MERLVTTSQASEILGLSLQGIHYRIKKNQLKSVKQNGKVFVYIPEDVIKTDNLVFKNQKEENKSSNQNLQSIIDVKDEQILLLKKSLKWMKRQYMSEISRLEKTQQKMIDVMSSEINLLQKAFHEMKNLYSIQQPQQAEIIESIEHKSEIKYLTAQEFFEVMKKQGKSQQQVKNIIFNALKSQDERFVYDKNENKLMILDTNFEDLIGV